MTSALAQLPQTLVGWAGFITLIIVGVFAVWGLFDKTLRDRRKDAVAAADDVIKALNERVDQLTNRVEELETEQAVHIKQIAELKATNETLTKILQGRDENTIKFQKEVGDAIKTTNGINEIIKKVERQVGTMAEAMERLAKALEAKK